VAFATKEDVVNYALTLLGVTRYVTSLSSPTSAEEVVASKVWDQAYRRTLEEVQPHFAVVREALTEDTSIEHKEWKYVYDVPSGVLVPLKLYQTTVTYWRPTVLPKYQPPFVIEYDTANAKNVLLTNLPDAGLVYVKDESDVTKYTPLFIEALAWTVAAAMSKGLRMEPSFQARADQMADLNTRRARAEEENRIHEMRTQDPPWILARNNKPPGW